MVLPYEILITALLFASSLEQEYPLITTSLGNVTGRYINSYGGRRIAAFEGIPYGKPPIESLRFAEPQSIDPWDGNLNATTLYTCAQGALGGGIAGSEDCLYLNVYVPQDLLNSDANIDTIIFIHGGAFIGGSPSDGGPVYLLDRDFVYVSINYRLGIFGFLSTGDDVVSGNNGLKDQVVALKWVHSHIKSFRGNPNSVTITGVSAGGISVHFQYLSSQSKGLFHRAIAHSGTALAPSVIQKAPLERARELGSYVGCNSLSTKELIECMRKPSVNELLEHWNKFYAFAGFPSIPFAPVVEQPSDTAFITDYPYRLLDSGNFNDVPILTTIVTAEGSLFYLLLGNSLTELNEQWNEALPYVLDYNYTVADSDKPLVADAIKQFYFGKENITDDDTFTAITLLGERYFVLDFERASRMQEKVAKSPTYSYIYNYKADIDNCSPGMNESYGVCHVADGMLLYQPSTAKLSESDERVKETLVDLISSFARNGKPETENVDWQPVSNADNFTYLFINGPDDINMVSAKEVAPTDFWRSLPIKEYEKIDQNTSSFSFSLRQRSFGLLFYGAFLMNFITFIVTKNISI